MQTDLQTRIQCLFMLVVSRRKLGSNGGEKQSKNIPRFHSLGCKDCLHKLNSWNSRHKKPKNNKNSSTNSACEYKTQTEQPKYLAFMLNVNFQ